MNNNSLEPASKLIRGVVELLWRKIDGLSGSELIARLPEVVQLTDYEIGIASSSQYPRYARNVHLVTLPLFKTGWLTKTDKGQWYLTEDGRDACRRFSNPQDLYLEASRLSEEYQQKVAETLMSLDMIEEKAWENIANYIRGKNTIEVRRLVAVLLEALQYHITWVAPPQKKRGLIDMVVNTDPIGAKTLRILVQVRHTGQAMTVEGMKSFFSILGPDDFGLLFSTGGFTSDARDVVNDGGYQKINAMDLEKFYNLWVKHYEKLSREAHTLLSLRAIFFLSPPE